MQFNYSSCIAASKAMLTKFYPNCQEHIEDFFYDKLSYKDRHQKYRRWLKIYQSYFDNLALSDEIQFSLCLLSIKEYYDSCYGLIPLTDKHIKHSTKHIILFKDILNHLKSTDKKCFPLKELTSFFLPIFDMLHYVLDEELTKKKTTEKEKKSFLSIDQLDNFSVYLKAYINTLELDTLALSDKNISNLIAVINLYFNFIFKYDIDNLQTYILNNSI